MARVCSDAPAARGDLGVGRPAESLVELALAPAGKRQVRVRVDEPRQDRAARGVDAHGPGKQSHPLGLLPLGADEDDRARA
jgi:hypothetical protein